MLCKFSSSFHTKNDYFDYHLAIKMAVSNLYESVSVSCADATVLVAKRFVDEWKNYKKNDLVPASVEDISLIVEIQNEIQVCNRYSFEPRPIFQLTEPAYEIVVYLGIESLLKHVRENLRDFSRSFVKKYFSTSETLFDDEDDVLHETWNQTQIFKLPSIIEFIEDDFVMPVWLEYIYTQKVREFFEQRDYKWIGRTVEDSYFPNQIVTKYEESYRRMRKLYMEEKMYLKYIEIKDKSYTPRTFVLPENAPEVRETFDPILLIIDGPRYGVFLHKNNDRYKLRMVGRDLVIQQSKTLEQTIPLSFLLECRKIE